MTGEQIALAVLVGVIFIVANGFYYAGAADARRFGQRRFVPLLALAILMSAFGITSAVLGVLLATGVLH